MSSGRAPASAPAGAVRLLDAALPPHERESIVGDLIEVFADRVDARRPFNRMWFWAQAFAIAVATVATRWSTPDMGGLHMGFTRAARRLAHDWRYAAAVIFILAIGIGPAAAMLSVVERVLLRPLDYYEPDRIGILRLDLGQLRDHPGISPSEAIDMRTSGLFAAVETETRLSEVSLGAPPNLVSLSQLSFTTGMLPLLGVTPALGRSFTEADMPLPPPPVPRQAGVAAPAVTLPPQAAMLDFMTWQTQFGGDPSIIGRLVQINGRSTEIVGVLPNGFRLITGRAVPQRIDIYTPLRLLDLRNSWMYPTLVKLRPGATFEQTQAGLDALSANIKQRHPEMYDGDLRFTVRPALEDMTRATRPALRAATAAVLLLLSIALANATALVIARQRACERDFAIRAAIGASRAALVMQVIVESVWLSAAGAVAGALLASLSIVGVRQIIPRTVPRWDQIVVGPDVVLYPAVLALGGLAVIGILPIWTILRTAPWHSMRSGSVQGGRAEGTASRFALVGAQVALTVVLAFGCAQLLRSASRLSKIDVGFDANVMTLRVPYDRQAFSTPAQRAELYQRIRDRVRTVPGVTSVGIVTHVPLSGQTMIDGYQADLSKEVSFDQSANYQAVSRGYFDTLRIRFVQGRDFTDQEDAKSQAVVIVDETLVRKLFPGDPDVIGRTLRLGWGLPNARIVGVVGHVQSIEVGRTVRPQIYAPIGNLFPGGNNGAGIVTVRASGDPRTLVPSISAAIREIGPGRAISNVAMLSDNVAAATSTLIAVAVLITCLALSAALLSATGLYLVIAFVVHERRRATAIRTALGATRQQVIWHHFKTSGAVLLAALPAGIFLSVAAAPFVSELVYGVGTRDWRSLLAAVGVAALAGVLGTWVPVRRAANADVLKVLREA